VKATQHRNHSHNSLNLKKLKGDQISTSPAYQTVEYNWKFLIDFKITTHPLSTIVGQDDKNSRNWSCPYNASTYNFLVWSFTEDSFGAAYVVMGGAPSASIEPVHCASRVARFLLVYQDKLFLGSYIYDSFHLLLKLWDIQANKTITHLNMQTVF